MTGFEKYMIEKHNFKRVEGNGTYNTYTNTSNGYKDDKGNYFLIGLYARPTRIGLISPNIIIGSDPYTSLPTPSQYEFIAKEIMS